MIRVILTAAKPPEGLLLTSNHHTASTRIIRILRVKHFGGRHQKASQACRLELPLW
jgi:hypothetical protein